MNHSFDVADRLITTADGNNHIPNFAYDASGNATSDGSYAYVWNAESQMKSGNGVGYTYDGDGRRVSKSNGKLYWYGAGSEILAETDASGNTLNEYVFFGGKRVALLPAGSTAQFYVEDSLGSSRIVTSNTGVVCYDADFYPYGGERPYTNSCSQNNYKFEGKERDTETGNDDFGARYYSNRFGRWLSADWSNVPVAVPYANLTNPQTLNLYAMVADDPESFADSDGHKENEPNQPGGQGQQNTSCISGGGQGPCPEAPPPPAQGKPPAQMTTMEFLGQEVRGVYDTTLAPIVNTVEHPVQTVVDAASNIAETATRLANDPKGTLTTAAGGAKDMAVEFGSQVASGNPRAIG